MKLRTTSISLMRVVSAGLLAQNLTVTQRDLQWLQWDAEHLHALGPKDAIGVAHGFTADERRELIRSFEADLKTSADDSAHSSNSALETALAEGTYVAKVDLNGDGTPEVVVRGAGDIWGSSPTGNGSIWVLQKTSKGYKTIVDSLGQNFSVMKTRTNGFRDLMVGMHGSATSQELKIYHYRDGRYFKDGCYSTDWSVLVHDDVIDLHKPVIRRCRR